MAATDFASFADKLDKIAANLPKAASDGAVSVATTILGDLVIVTPVDTSAALSNWQIGLGTPIDSPIDPYYPGIQGSTYTVSGQEALAAGKAKLVNKIPGQPIYISNVLPYIQRLNEGYSGQAPAGFVERAALIGALIIKKIKLF